MDNEDVWLALSFLTIERHTGYSPMSTPEDPQLLVKTSLEKTTFSFQLTLEIEAVDLQPSEVLG